MMFRGLRLSGVILVAGLVLSAPAFAQDNGQTLADIRAELDRLAGDLQGLRSELVASGASGIQAAGGASALDRMNTMEAALSQLTARSEALENRINRVVADGTNRLGDLEFRLCEIETGCDVGAIGATPMLGGAGASTPAPAPSGGGSSGASAPATAPSSSLAMNEQSDFDRAKAVLDQGDFRGAADQLATFAQTYTGGPLTGEAMYLRGEALKGAGDLPGAARAWLEAFSSYPEGPRAPDSLLMLGQSLGELGQMQEACATLAEVGFRFPSSPVVAKAGQVMQGFQCH
ncbi:tol-pal system protein YbgF [Phaeovulum sp. W22_SRMD_FR3]|uniref:tol-pal system protein YbgF n=1 Tax=Phaeovulum sp. W22_SRMD_FR3 TaxID=3240274 RepID=UPI003F9B04FF